MWSDDDFLIATNGIEIENNRNNKDFAYVNDILFSGCSLNNTYPKKRSGEYFRDSSYWKKGDKRNLFFISGGDDRLFEAKMI